MWRFISDLGAAVIVEVLKLLVPTMFEDIAAIIRKIFAIVSSGCC
jgi:hypothetical protein